MTNRLKVLRATCDWTQSDLADRVGVSRQTIHAIEKGNYIPSTLLALKLARVFDVTVEQVFSLEENDWEAE